MPGLQSRLYLLLFTFPLHTSLSASVKWVCLLEFFGSKQHKPTLAA